MARTHTLSSPLRLVHPQALGVGVGFVLLTLAMSVLALVLTVGPVIQWPVAAPSASPSLQVVDTHVPRGAVNPLDRVYLSTTVANPSASDAQNLAVKFEVVGSDGSTVISGKQSGIGLEGHGQRMISWAWRVPGGLEPGTYSVRASVLESNGRVIAATGSPLPTIEVTPR
jgi:hypothetical protein